MADTVMGCTHFYASLGDVLRGFGNARLFNLENCECCDRLIEAANPVSLVDVSFADIEHLEWSFMRFDQGGWNDNVGGVVCDICDQGNQEDE